VRFNGHVPAFPHRLMFAVEAEQPSVRTTASVRMGLLMRFAAPQHLMI
jgi:hypothetical protein